MRLYFCRMKDDHSVYMGHLNPARPGYTVTRSLDEVIFSPDYEGMQENAYSHPELEVCCLDATPMPVFPAMPSEVLRCLDIPGVDPVDTSVAVWKLMDALETLRKLKPTLFCELDDGGALSVYDSVKYDPDDGRIYINLEYHHTERRGQPIPGIRKMNLE